VLIVEDDPDQLALADLRVSMAGYRVRVARDLRALRADLQSQPLPDLVLLDVQLPDRSGFEILEAMRRHPSLALLPVIMLTAMVGAEDVSRGLALGADGYITKPYSKTVITETIRQVLKQA
jgi:DNA-binding response OmpR family regulator